MALNKTEKSPRDIRYQVGTRVRIPFGLKQVEGRIVEDRGILGVGRRRLYGIKYLEDQDEPRYTELSADEFEVIED